MTRLLIGTALVLTAFAVLPTVVPANAQGAIRCSAFLHQADGSWRSFADGTVLGPRGPIPVKTGERFVRGAGAKGEIAQALDGLCLGEP